MVLGTNGSIIIGVIIGTLVLLVVGILIFYVRRRKSKKAASPKSFVEIAVISPAVDATNTNNGNTNDKTNDVTVQYDDSFGKNNPFIESVDLSVEIQKHFNTLPRSPGRIRGKFDNIFQTEALTAHKVE
ncbi:uncharacterized protein LOC105845907 isoform X1 [Hydra vulgaris]|uniref:uncharacterized protein LOC105845907 isoform X1 n=1 Tax=Hydra vulgaris TaxID=6087 RepID=UPI000641479B|nr:uncharacterized protein LOC105845907 [Hydra vulgaris]